MAFLLCSLLLTVPGLGPVLADIGPGDRSEAAQLPCPYPAVGPSEGEANQGREANYSDEFDNASLDPKWSWYNPPASYDMGVTRTGALHMVANRATNFAATSDNGALLYQTLNGSFSLETKIFSNPLNNYEKSGLMARQDANNWVALKYQRENGAVVELSVKSGGAVNDRVLTPLSASPVYLRLERDGSTFTTYYSADGANWTKQWSSAQVMNDTLNVGLLIADGNANTDYAADFDYFRFRLPNRSPFISQAFTPVSVDEDMRLGLKAYDHFSDPDGDALAYTIAAPHIKGWPNNATRDLDVGGAPNWFGAETALVTATDPSGLSVTTPVNVTVTPVQDPPFLSKGIPNVTMAQNGTDLSLNLSRCFADNDTQYGDRLAYSVQGNGSTGVTISPTGNVELRAPIDFWGRQNITFIAADSTQLLASGVCMVTVNHVNQAPQVRTSPPDQLVDEDGNVTVDLGPVFWDPDGDPITIFPSGNVQIQVLQHNGSLDVTFRPVPDASGFAETIALTAKDDEGLGTNYARIRVTVLPVNDPPRLAGYAPAADASLEENKSQLFNITAVDPESGPLENCTWCLDGEPVLYGRTEYLYRANFSSAGNHTVEVSVSDGELNVSMSWKVAVRNVNREPAGLKVTSPKPGETYMEGALVSLEGAAEDPDGDALEYTWLDGGSVLGNGTKLSLALPPGPHSLVLQVSDKTATIKSAAVKITVKANTAPRLLSLDPSSGQKFVRGDRVRFEVRADDADQDVLTYCWTENGKVLSTERLFYSSSLPVGAHQIHVSISDGGASAGADLTIEVTEPPAGTPAALIGAGIAAGLAALAAVAVAAFLLLRRRRLGT